MKIKKNNKMKYICFKGNGDDFFLAKNKADQKLSDFLNHGFFIISMSEMHDVSRGGYHSHCISIIYKEKEL